MEQEGAVKMETNARGFIVPQKKFENNPPSEVRDGECYVNKTAQKTYKRINGQWVCLDEEEVAEQSSVAPAFTVETLCLLAFLAFDVLMVASAIYAPVWGLVGLIVLGMLVWRIK